MILSHFPQGIQCFCLMCSRPCTLLRHQKMEWKLTFLLGIPVQSGDIPAPGLFLDNILGKGSVTRRGSLKRLSWKSLSAQSLGFLSCSGAVYNLAFSVFYHYENMYYWERVEVKCLSSVLNEQQKKWTCCILWCIPPTYTKRHVCEQSRYCSRWEWTSCLVCAKSGKFILLM